MHPLPILLNNGVPVTLNNDDPSIFGNFGLSYDFFQVLISSEVTGLMTLADIARRSFAVGSTLSCWMIYSFFFLSVFYLGGRAESSGNSFVGEELEEFR